jgi:hypothetical protein
LRDAKTVFSWRWLQHPIRRRELLAADRNQAQKGGSMQLNTDVTKALAPR